MRRKNFPDVDARVQSYVHEWEKQVTQQLQSTKVKLMWCSSHERAELKTHLETLGGVLDLLQGKKAKETGNRELSEEISSLKSKLGKSEANVQLLLAAFHAQKKLNKDLKIQLRRQFKVSLNAEKKNQELRQHLMKTRETKASGSTQLNPEAPAELSTKQENAASRQVAEVLQDRSPRKEVPDKEQEAPQLRTEELKADVGGAAANPVQEKRERRRKRRERAPNVNDSDYSKSDDKRAAEQVAEQAAEQAAEQTGVSADLKAALMKVCQQLSVQHQGIKELLSQRDQRWEERFEELRSRLEKLESKKKRRGWF